MQSSSLAALKLATPVVYMGVTFSVYKATAAQCSAASKKSKDSIDYVSTIITMCVEVDGEGITEAEARNLPMRLFTILGETAVE